LVKLQVAHETAQSEAVPTIVAPPAARPGPSRAGRRRRGRLGRRRALTGLGLVLPAFLVVAIFFLVPLGWAFYISLTNWPLVGAYHYIGFANYTALVHDSVFLHSLVFTIEYTAIITPCVFLVGYGLAVLIRRRVKGIGIFRAMYFLPTVVGLSTISFMAFLELQPNSGVVDFLLSKLHIAEDSTAWLASPGLALIGISVLVIWGASGLTMIILMAGMMGIPEDLYQAAEVDGAGRWAKEWRITLPLLRRSIALSLIISVIGSLLAFNQFEILTGGGPGTSTTTVVQWIYEVGFSQFHLGYATAMSIVLLVIVVLVSSTQFLLLRDRD
jgi:multiple sugar transport system permease protein